MLGRWVLFPFVVVVWKGWERFARGSWVFSQPRAVLCGGVGPQAALAVIGEGRAGGCEWCVPRGRPGRRVAVASLWLARPQGGG